MKYNSSHIQTLATFINDMNTSNFWKHSSVHHIACLLGVCRDTIYEWQKQYPEFSDTIKRWEEKRNATFLELRDKNSAWIFLAKNWLGMIDEQKIKQKHEFEPLTVIINKDGDEPEGANEPE